MITFCVDKAEISRTNMSRNGNYVAEWQQTPGNKAFALALTD